jgi:hypothetical protein
MRENNCSEQSKSVEQTTMQLVLTVITVSLEQAHQFEPPTCA